MFRNPTKIWSGR